MSSRLLRAGLLPTAVAMLVVATEQRVIGVCSPQIVMSPQGNNAGQFISVSGDGRYSAFGSYASDLVPGHLDFQLYVFDRQTCGFERVSVSSDETQAGAGTSPSGPSISDDGRYVAFYSHAGNLVPGDTNLTTDVFVRDRQTGTTVRASVDSSGNEGNSYSNVPAISGNGQVVAFVSVATNLVAGDTNGVSDVFVRDLVANTTTRVSVATGGGQASGGGGSEQTEFFTPSLALSNDGRFVFFSSGKADLVAGDTNTFNDIFRHDRQTGTTIRVSVASDGGQANFDSSAPAASGDGRYVAFHSRASNLVPGDDTIGTYDVFVRDITMGLTTRASVMGHGGGGFAVAIRPSISGDGRYVAFDSAEGLIVPDDTNGFSDVFVRDRLTAITRRISVSAAGGQGNNYSTGPSLSDDGTFVGYHSLASNLVPGDVNGGQDVFVTDWQALPPPVSSNRLTNGDFSGGLAPWTTYAVPNPDDIVWNTDGGVLQFYRKTGSTQAVVLQNTSSRFLANTPLIAQFDLGNSSAVRKRIKVLLHHQAFQDLYGCTFWLEPSAPLQTYQMRTHTTVLWEAASISFYAGTADNTGFYQVDNVSLTFEPTGSDLRTECVDPTAPAPPGGAPSGNLVSNGDFSSGLPPWGTYGSIVWQIAGGVFEFHRPAPPPTPTGVVLQGTGQAMVAGDIMTASFKLGNSSSVPKRVKLLLHEGNFSDLSGCTFVVRPGAPLAAYTAKMFATKAWTNATLSLYAATSGPEQWTQLDDVVFERTPAASILGTECLEPVPPPEYSLLTILTRAGPSVAPGPVVVQGVGGSRLGPTGGAVASSAGPRIVSLPAPVDLRRAGGQLTFQSWLSSDSSGEVQVSFDGETWQTVATVSPSSEWISADVDLAPFAGHLVYVRFRLARSEAATPEPVQWLIEDVRLER